MNFLLNFPLNKAFTNCPSVLYQNYLRDIWSTVVAYDPSSSVDETEQCPLREFLIKFSVLNEQGPLTLDFNTLCSSTSLDYKNGKYVATPIPEVVKLSAGTIPPLNPSKVPNIELMAHMIAVNNQKDLVSPLLFSRKKKKVKSQIVTPTLPKSQGPKASESHPQKRKKPMSKKVPKETKATLPSSQRRVLRNPTQRKLQPFPEGTTSDPKDSGGNVQYADKGLPSMISNKGTAKTTPRPERPLGDKDSEGNIPPADMKPINPTIVDPSGTGAEYQESDEKEVFAARDDMEEETQAGEEEYQSPSPNKEKLELSYFPATQESDSDSSSPDVKKFNNTIPLTERQLIKYLRKVSRILFSRINKEQLAQHEEADVSYASLRASIEGYYEENIYHRDHTYKLVQATMDSFDKTSTDRAYTEKPPPYTEGEHVTIEDDAKKPESEKAKKEPTKVVPISTDPILEIPTPEVQPITTIISTSQPEPRVPQREGKAIATDDQPKVQTKLVRASKIVREDLDEPISVIQEEAEKIGLDSKTIISTKAGEKFKKAHDAKHQVLKREHSLKSKRAMELRKKRFEQYIWTTSSRLRPEPITDSALPAPTPEQAPSESSGRKRKHMELQPKIKVHGLECNRSLPKGILFVNNMVIEEPEYGIFFTDVFGDQAFQRWNYIHKVRVDSLVSYLVMALVIKTQKNAMFSLKLRKLIIEHPDQKNLKSKKVKLEALGYNLD
nr:copia protein [Tanacetum cinerariifolium]